MLWNSKCVTVRCWGFHWGMLKVPKIYINGPMNMILSKINYRCTHEPITSP
jgi:hypothetical protein